MIHQKGDAAIAIFKSAQTIWNTRHTIAIHLIARRQQRDNMPALSNGLEI